MTRVSSSAPHPLTDTRPSVETSNRQSTATGRSASLPSGGGQLGTLKLLGRTGRIGSANASNTPRRAAIPQLTREPSFGAWLPNRPASSANPNPNPNANATVKAKTDNDDWTALLDPIFRQAPNAAGSPSARDNKASGVPRYSLIDAPKIPSRDRLDDFVQRHEQLAIGLRRAIGKAQQAAQSASPVSWKTALLATFTKSGKRDMANKLSAKRDELKSLHAEFSRLLTGSEVKNATRSEIQWEKQDPQRKEKALQADRAMAETQRWRPTAQTFLRNIGEQLQALELDLAKLSKPTH